MTAQSVTLNNMNGTTFLSMDFGSSTITDDLLPTATATIINFSNATYSTALQLSVLERHTQSGLFAIYRPSIDLIDKILTPVWYAVGFPGNTLAAIVWLQARMRPSSGCYLAALAIDDFVFLLLQMVFELQSAWNIGVLRVPVFCELFPIIFLASQYLSPLLVLGFTVERYISVCHPFQRERCCSTRRAVCVIIGLVLFSLSLHGVQGYFWTYSAENDGDCSPRASVTADGTRSLWTVYSWITELLVFGVVPLAILALNLLVIRETRRMVANERKLMRMAPTAHSSLQKSAKKSDNGKGQHHQHQQRGSRPSATTVMLLAVSFYLIFSTLPVTVCYAIYFTFPEGDPAATDEQIWTDPTWQNYLSYWNVRTVIQEFGMSHFACNFYIYLLTGQVFRKELRMLLMRLFCRKQAQQLAYRDRMELNGVTPRTMTASGATVNGSQQHNIDRTV